MSVHRTGLRDFLLDSLDFIQERIEEALTNPASQLAAINEAGCAIPQMERRLRDEDEGLWSGCLLAFGPRIQGTGWWENFAKMKRPDFTAEAESLLAPDGQIEAVRGLLKS